MSRKPVIIEIQCNDGIVNFVGLYTLSTLTKTIPNISTFKEDWTEVKNLRRKMGGDHSLLDLAWMLKKIQKYGWVLESYTIPIDTSVVV